MAENNRAEVRIYGQQYTIAGTASIEDMERVAEYVDGIMHQLSKNLPSLTTMSLAVLTAVNTASEYFEVARKSQSQSEEIESMKHDIENYSRLWEEAKISLLKYQEETRGGVEKLQELQRIFNKKNDELVQMKEALDEMNAKYQETLGLLKVAEEAALQETGSTSDEAVIEELEALQSEKDTIQSQLEELQSEKDTLQSQNEALQSDKDALQSQSETLQSENDSLQKENDSLQKKAASLEKQVSELSSGETKDVQGMSEFLDKYKELENSFFDIQMENIQLKNELDQYRKQDS